MQFLLTREQIETFRKWKLQFDNENPGATGGTFTFSFTPTSIFTIIIVKHISGLELDLTDYSH